MQTLVKGVESVINTKPVDYVDDDINSTIALTPSSCLTLNQDIGIPEVNSDEEADSAYLDNPSRAHNLLKIWKKGRRINTFWTNWKDEYLLSLREIANKTTRAKDSITVCTKSRGRNPYQRQCSPWVLENR
ncbi:hypothetical protein DPMN_113103 [Dreissena polymorpha]|uniref:DUF5641 domain-containing protein n=1 Tax=Dreissena polymorpha TaxID=45954 RepID=A0A9D4QRJ5_DREPO|nr:hypothetical protein DPMN_113103 [Dreissena polymorpha]